MLPHQQRVVDELAALRNNIGALSTFILQSPIFSALSGEEQGLLREQRRTMRDYASILERRIMLFAP